MFFVSFSSNVQSCRMSRNLVLAVLMMFSLGGCYPISHAASQANPFLRIEYSNALADAEKGDVEAQLKVARVQASACQARCAYGPMTWLPPCEKDAAHKWYLRAAEQGSAEAQTQMGYYYIGGLMLASMSKAMGSKDLPEARKWFQMAADQNYEPAIKALAELSKAEADYAESVKWNKTSSAGFGGTYGTKIHEGGEAGGSAR